MTVAISLEKLNKSVNVRMHFIAPRNARKKESIIIHGAAITLKWRIFPRNSNCNSHKAAEEEKLA